MKKILSIAVGLLFIANISAQEDKKVRFGLSVAPSVNWYKPENKRVFEYNGPGIGFQWGLDLEYKLNDIASIYTGLKLTNDAGKISFTQDSVGYQLSPKADKFIDNESITSDNFYLLKERSYRVNYVTLPVGVKMKTNEIGYLTYFGQFGLNTSIRTKARATDLSSPFDIKTGTSSAEATIDDLNIDDDMNLFRFQLSIGGGAEYNLSGSTSIVFGLNYNLGFSNVARKTSRYIKNMQAENINQRFTAHNIALTVGILF